MTLPRLLLLLLALSPVASAQAPPNFDKVCARLADAVEAGELTVEQADTMIASLAQRRLREHMEHRRRAKASSGDASAAVKALREMGVDEDTLGKVKQGFVGAGLEGERLVGAFNALARLVHGLRAGIEPSEELQRYVKERLKLDEKQLRHLHGYAHRLHKATSEKELTTERRPDRKMHDEKMTWAKEILAKRGGFEGEALTKALRTVARMSTAMRYGSEEAAKKLAERMDTSQEQFALLLSVATRISNAEELKKPAPDEKLPAAANEYEAKRKELQAALKELKEAMGAGKIEKEAAQKKATAIMEQIDVLKQKELDARDALQPLDIRYRTDRTDRKER